ncbi:MAG: dihydrolipoyllysine-residue acetyltransferase [Pseudomonadota bacterium]
MVIQDVSVPDLGGPSDVDVIEVLVRPGDSVGVNDSLITLESDKATMDVPSPYTGTVKAVNLSVGEKVSEGTLILTMDVADTPADETTQQKEGAEVPVAEEMTAEKATGTEPRSTERQEAPSIVEPAPAPVTKPSLKEPASVGEKAYASPSVRRVARELGVNLSALTGSGRKGRILKEDVQAYVKRRMQQPAGGFSVPEQPAIDFAQFGAISTSSLSRIKKLSGTHLHRSWVSVPHVTQFDEADVTELETFRRRINEELKGEGVKLSFLPFLIKAAVAALKAYPEFNASLDSGGEQLVVKHYYNIGVAVDTPEGLVVPVIRDADTKGVLALARELAEVSERARGKRLKPGDMQGGSFSISSLGGIGGTAFTPIVNVPEVAILGVSRSVMKPVYREGEFEPRLMLPLSLSYDHRIIDGAAAARFTTVLGKALADMRRVLL